MPGCGAAGVEAGGGTIGVELRSVNGKFCEVKARLPRELSALETELIKTGKARVARGVIDAFVRRGDGAAKGGAPRVDLPLATAYAKALRELKDELGLAGEPSVHDVAAMEGVISLGEAAADAAARGPARPRARSGWARCSGGAR